MPKNATLFFDIELLKIDEKSVNECNEDNGQWYNICNVLCKEKGVGNFIWCQIFKNHLISLIFFF